MAGKDDPLRVAAEEDWGLETEPYAAAEVEAVYEGTVMRVEEEDDDEAEVWEGGSNWGAADRYAEADEVFGGK